MLDPRFILGVALAALSGCASSYGPCLFEAGETSDTQGHAPLLLSERILDEHPELRQTFRTPALTYVFESCERAAAIMDDLESEGAVVRGEPGEPYARWTWVQYEQQVYELTLGRSVD